MTGSTMALKGAYRLVQGAEKAVKPELSRRKVAVE